MAIVLTRPQLDAIAVQCARFRTYVTLEETNLHGGSTVALTGPGRERDEEGEPRYLTILVGSTGAVTDLS